MGPSEGSGALGGETLVRLGEAGKHLPPGRGGRPIGIATIFRWAGRGVRGVVLETAYAGGMRYTSAEAIRRFVERSTAARAAVGDPTPVPLSTTSRRAAAELEAAGF